MPVFPGGQNTWVNSPTATKGMMVGYSRNPKTFPSNRYLQIIPSSKPSGYYGVWTSRQAGRILTPDGKEWIWADGGERPGGLGNLESWTWNPLLLRRYAPAFTLGNIAISAADFPILINQGTVPAQQLMTLRALQIVNSLKNPPLGTNPSDPTPWGTNTSATASGITNVNGNWSNGSDGLGANNPPNIKISLNFGQAAIVLNTLGAVRPDNMRLLINYNTASRMATAPEVISYLKYGPYALGQLKGDVPTQNDMWGLPPTLYGMEVVIEDTVVVTSLKGTAVEVIVPVFPDGAAWIVSRIGAIEGVEGSPNLSTVQMYYYEHEMTVQTFSDNYNERTVGSVVSMFGVVVPNVYSSYYFQDVFA